VVLLLVAIALVAILRQPSGGRLNKHAGVCRINLRFIEGAKQDWANEYHKTTNDPAPTLQDLAPFLARGPKPVFPLKCPSNGQYTPGALDQAPKCSLAESEH
jgi:hypothetical protein